jgi:indole-3-glycerol phosphate synthase
MIEAGTFLERIVDSVRETVAQRQAAEALAAVRARAEAQPPPRDFLAAVRRYPEGATGGAAGEPETPIRAIAEIKRVSPSKGPLRPDLSPAEVARLYREGGAAAISVLTEERFFQGSLADMMEARAACGLPTLRKEFTLDEYQVYEARACGADAVLLIVAMLDDARLRDLHAAITGLGMTALVEAYHEREVERAVAVGARLIGINNRDLHTFRVDTDNALRLRPLIPPGVVAAALSGINSRADVERVAGPIAGGPGYDAILVGEAVVRSADPVAKLRELLGPAAR